MSILSATGRIVMVLSPINGRWGMHKLMAKLSTNEFGINWDPTKEITLVTFNRKRTLCKLLKYEISYLRTLQMLLLRLKVITLMSSSPFNFTPIEPELIMSISL